MFQQKVTDTLVIGEIYAGMNYEGLFHFFLKPGKLINVLWSEC